MFCPVEKALLANNRTKDTYTVFAKGEEKQAIDAGGGDEQGVLHRKLHKIFFVQILDNMRFLSYDCIKLCNIITEL